VSRAQAPEAPRCCQPELRARPWHADPPPRARASRTKVLCHQDKLHDVAAVDPGDGGAEVADALAQARDDGLCVEVGPGAGQTRGEGDG